MTNGTCRDVDECARDTCPVDSTCENSEGSFVCHCGVGFFLDADLCRGGTIIPYS